jgi:hypothetical protein
LPRRLLLRCVGIEGSEALRLIALTPCTKSDGDKF